MSKCPDIEKKRVGQKAKGQDGKQWIVALRKCRGSDKKCKYWKRVSATFALPKPKKRTKSKTTKKRTKSKPAPKKRTKSKPAPKKRAKSKSKTTTKSKDVTFNLPAPKAATKKRTKSKASPKKPKTASKKRGRPKGSKNKKKSVSTPKAFFKVPYSELVVDHTFSYKGYGTIKYVDTYLQYDDVSLQTIKDIYATSAGKWMPLLPSTPHTLAAGIVRHYIGEQFGTEDLDFLLSLGFQINYHNYNNGYLFSNYDSIMHFAISINNVDLVKRLIDMEFDFSAFKERSYEYEDYQGTHKTITQIVSKEIQKYFGNAPKKNQVFFKVHYDDLIYDNTMKELAYEKDYRVHIGDYKNEKDAYPVEENVVEDSTFEIFEDLFATEKQWATPNRLAADIIMYQNDFDIKELEIMVEMGFDINYHNINHGYEFSPPKGCELKMLSIMHLAYANGDKQLIDKLTSMGFKWDAFSDESYGKAGWYAGRDLAE
jgi:hypothetical protein